MPSVPLLTLEEAQASLLELATPLPLEHVDIECAIGRYLAQPLHARRTQPAVDLSAMDGYAVGRDDRGGPWRVIGESAAGRPFSAMVSPGEAVRISTGAMLPAGAGAVIVQEDTARDGDTLTFTGAAPPSQRHVRRRGMDFCEDAQVLAEGSRIGPAQAALAIAAGHRHLPVRRRPRVVLLDSGDELAADPECCLPHQIPASNGAMLLAMVRALPVDATRIGPIADTLPALVDAFARCEEADVIVTSGGASVGDHDLIRPALEAWGAQIRFWRIAIKPGKPVIVATRPQDGRQQIVLGLPGNPASSFVTAFLFLLPLVRRLLGAQNALPLRIQAMLGSAVPAGGSRREFLRAHWDGARVVLQNLQDSGALASLAASNALIDRPPNAFSAIAEDQAWIYPLENGGIA